jgi:hypothetical protein
MHVAISKKSNIKYHFIYVGCSIPDIHAPDKALDQISQKDYTVCTIHRSFPVLM